MPDQVEEPKKLIATVKLFTGRPPEAQDAGTEEFANPYHDPETGRFTESPGTRKSAESIADIARDPGAGGTVSPRTGKRITTGYLIAREELSAAPLASDLLTPGGRKIYTDWLKKARSSGAFKKNKVHVGIWHDPDSGRVFLDISEQYPSNTNREKAKKLGTARNQKSIAFLDGDNVEIIDTGGTGGLEE